MAAFLANVGVNASHAAKSRCHPDGSFELVPIPERLAWEEPMFRFESLPDIRHLVPTSWLTKAAHLDPDLLSPTPTYGDNCRRAGRAYSLRHAEPGNVIAFVARLWGAQHASFHVVGVLLVSDILADVTADPGHGWWDGNAHVRRARASGDWDSFWVFRGDKHSRLLDKSIPLDRTLLRELFPVETWHWPETRTELQTIGSHTRAVRRLTGHAENHLRSLVEPMSEAA